MKSNRCCLPLDVHVGIVLQYRKKTNRIQGKGTSLQVPLGTLFRFFPLRTQVLAMKPTPTLGEAYRLSSKDEQRRSIVVMWSLKKSLRSSLEISSRVCLGTIEERPQVEVTSFQTYSQGRRDINSSQQKHKIG